MTDPASSRETDDVLVSVPAVAEQVAVLRAAAGVIASRLDFSLDDIDDLRILIDEAASVLLTSGASGRLDATIATGEDSVSFTLRGVLPDGQEPNGEGFAWNILQALAHDLTTRVEDGVHVLTVTRRRGPVLEPARVDHLS